MKNYIRFVLRYILIPLGTLFCFTNALMLFMNSTGESVGSLTVMLLALQIVFSALIIIFANTEKKAVSLYVGSLYLAWAFMNIVVYAADDYGIIEFWPCFVLIAGILLIVAGYYKYKKLKFGFVIPSVTLVGMGLWYMLLMIMEL